MTKDKTAFWVPNIPDFIYVKPDSEVVCVYGADAIGHTIPYGSVMVGGAYYTAKHSDSLTITPEDIERCAKEGMLACQKFYNTWDGKDAMEVYTTITQAVLTEFVKGKM